MITVLVCLALSTPQICAAENAFIEIHKSLTDVLTPEGCLMLGMQLAAARAQSLDLPKQTTFTISCEPPHAT
jgi:hypothetical protein